MQIMRHFLSLCFSGNRVTTLLLAVLLSLGLGFSSTGAIAGEVTLRIQTVVTVNHDAIKARVNLLNKGNESAYQLMIQADFQEQRRTKALASELGVNRSAKADFSFTRPKKLLGTYPLFLSLNYSHEDGTRTSTVAFAKIETEQAQPAGLIMQAESDISQKNGLVSVRLSGSPNTRKKPEKVLLTAHFPDTMTLSPGPRNVVLVNGSASLEIQAVAKGNGPAANRKIYLVAEYDRDNRHFMVATDLLVHPLVTADQSPGGQVSNFCMLLSWIFLLMAAFFFLSWLFHKNPSTGSCQRGDRHRLTRLSFDFSLLSATICFILGQLPISLLLTSTITTGGDTASHYYTLAYLRDTLLPAGKISGWTMGNYAGFPILQFYFPLPFLLMSVLASLLGVPVAFKLISLAGVLLLPFGVYFLLRFLRVAFPGPAMGAVCSLLFLFNPANSMWGGNLLSTLAGEFSYSLSLALSLLLIGSLYRGAKENKWIIFNGLLVFLVGFSHGYTLLFVEVMSLFLLFSPAFFIGRLIYLLKVFGLAFCLLAFWLVPLLAFGTYTTAYHLAWQIGSFAEVLPPILVPVALLAAVGSLTLLFSRMRGGANANRDLHGAAAYLWFGLLAAGFMYLVAPELGVVDIRYIPYGQMMLVLLAATCFGWLVSQSRQKFRPAALVLFCVLPATLFWTGRNLGPVNAWSRWNYEGFEGKKTWPLFRQINDSLRGSFQDPRVIFEHSQAHNSFGSSRAFESLPLFAGRATLEGLYMQASPSAPFVFYLQAEISKEASRPFPQYSYPAMNFEQARKRLDLFNVRDLILRSAAAKKAIRKADGYSLKQSFGPYELWQRNDGRYNYVTPLAYQPVIYDGGNWKEAAFNWFRETPLPDVHLLFRSGEAIPLKLPTIAKNALANLPHTPIEVSQCQVKEKVGKNDLTFQTNCLGLPHLIKISYHPNWRVSGADRIYLVSPSFMLVYPTATTVRLRYGPGIWGRLGMGLSLAALALLMVHLVPSICRKLPAVLCLRSPQKNAGPKPAAGNSFPYHFFLVIVAALGLLLGGFSLYSYCHNPQRLFQQAIRDKDRQKYEQARKTFAEVMEKLPTSDMAEESSYYIAVSYFLEHNDREAIRAFNRLAASPYDTPWLPAARYHLVLLYFRTGQPTKGRSQFLRLKGDYPDSDWTKNAGKFLVGQKRDNAT